MLSEAVAFLPGLPWRKRCRACDTMKPLTEFYPTKANRDGLQNKCKVCANAYSIEYARKNPEKVRAAAAAFREKNPEYSKTYYAKNREKRYENWKRWVEQNREHYNTRVRARRAATPELQIATRKRRLAKPEQNIANRMKSRIRQAFEKRGQLSDKAGRSWRDLVGYDVLDLMRHIERQFTGSMSWENFGRWEIDHIVPVASFSFSSVDDPDFRVCWALTNLRPLWKKRNRMKAARVLTLL